MEEGNAASWSGGAAGDLVSDARWRVAVNRETCIGSGVCAGTAPAFFRLDGGTACPVDESPAPDDVLLDAAESCPSESITVRDGDGNLLAPEW
jgi:ferredoxin